MKFSNFCCCFGLVHMEQSRAILANVGNEPVQKHYLSIYKKSPDQPLGRDSPPSLAPAYSCNVLSLQRLSWGGEKG